MLKSRITIIIIALVLTACNSLPERSSELSPANVAHEVSPNKHKLNSPEVVKSPTATPKPASPDNATELAYEDVWHRIKDNLSLDRHKQQASVVAKVKWYARHQAYLDRVAVRARPYIFHIVEELERRNMPVELALLPIVESAYHPFAYSRSHASGIWQFIPGTGKDYGLKQNWWYDGRRDIVAATEGALNYLEKLHKEFKGNWLHALAAYNTGERNVGRAIKRNIKAHKKTDFWSLRLPRETRGYVPSLLAVAELLANSEQYGVQFQKIENKAHFVQIDVQRQLDLATAAKLAELSMDEMYTLNPAFNRWATDPDGPHRLLIPVNKGETFKTLLASLSESERITWKRHVIKRGESLSVIAQNYRTSVSALKQTNKIRKNLIREGQSLLIPSAKHPLKHYTLSLDSRRYRGLKKSADGNNHIYTVRRGDTLWDIGRQYGVSIKQICNWNGINSKSILRPGKKLNLRLLVSEKNTPKAIPVNYEKNSTISYTVKKGDSLWLIARRHKVTVAQLLRWNNIVKNKHLKPGQRLIVQNSQNKITGV